MENELENQDALNPEGVQDTTPEIESTDTPTLEDYNKTKEYAKNQKIRAEKAEKELKTFKANQPKETETPKNEEKKSNEPDYAERLEKVVLKTEGVTHPDDQKFVLDMAKRLKLSVDEVLQEDYVKAKLKSANIQREAESGMPSGSGKAGGTAKNSVDYWVDRVKSDGTFETPDDPELAKQVIEKRISKHEKANQFDEIRV
jgi:hypothetical protein